MGPAAATNSSAVLSVILLPLNLRSSLIGLYGAGFPAAKKGNPPPPKVPITTNVAGNAIVQTGSICFNGSVLRMVVEMEQFPRAKMVIDTGNSGHPGHKNFADQSELWQKGDGIEIISERKYVEKIAVGTILLSKKLR